jgi:hypothetical protein
MILVRMVFQAKFGKAGELAAAFKAFGSSGAMPGANVRVFTDLSGPFDTVVQEIEAESLDAYQRSQAAMFADPKMRDLLGKTGDLIVSGHKEYYTIEFQQDRR